MKVDILSDIPYNYYQHINQSLYRYMSKNNKVRFLQKFFLHSPNITRIKKLKNDANFKKSHKDESIVDILGLPSLSKPVDFFIYIYLKNKYKLTGDVCITFVANSITKSIINNYDKKIYYCVHDYKNQGVNNRKLIQEKLVVEKCDLIFCDNETVLERLSGSIGYKNVFDAEGDEKFILVPPLVNENFYNLKSDIVKYDYIYYGTFHKDINTDIFKVLAELGFKIAIISNNCDETLKNINNINIYNATTDFIELTTYLSQADCILLPYKNNDFMETVTPAKIYQSIATGKKVCTTNLRLSKKYHLDYLNEDNEYLSCDNVALKVDDFSENNIISHIIKLIGVGKVKEDFQ